jgi:hypothetical protein
MLRLEEGRPQAGEADETVCPTVEFTRQHTMYGSLNSPDSTLCMEA